MIKKLSIIVFTYDGQLLNRFLGPVLTYKLKARFLQPNCGFEKKSKMF